MYHNELDGPSKMQTKIDQLEREKSEMTGLLTMLRQKVQESSEEIFDLRTNMATIEAEADYVKQKAAESNVREVQKLETKLAFMDNQLKQAATAKLRALKDLETVRKNAQLEQKRLSAEKRLQVTKRRNFEQKQHILFSQSQMPAFRNDTNDRGVQVALDTDVDDTNYLLENANLLSELTESPLAPHLLAMLSAEVAEKPQNNLHSISLSQPTQIFKPPAAAPIDLGLLLQKTLSVMLTGTSTCLDLLPVLIEFMSYADELDPETLASSVRIFHAIIRLNSRFHDYLCRPTPRTESAFIQSRLSNFTIPSDFVLEKSVATFPIEMNGMREKAIRTICRLLKNQLSSTDLITSGLHVLGYWISQVGANDLHLFELLVTDRLLQEIVLSPNSSLQNQSYAVDILTSLCHSPLLLKKLTDLSKQSLLFNRLSRMLSNQKSYLPLDKDQINKMYLRIVSLLSTMIAVDPILCIPFLLQYTRGQSNEVDGEKSIVYHLLMLLDHETSRYRTTHTKIDPDTDVQLICDTFTLFSVLVHYTQIDLEVSDCRQIHILHCILLWIQKGVLQHHSFAKTADRLASMLKIK